MEVFTHTIGLHPIPEFDGKTILYDACAVDRASEHMLSPMPVDEQTGLFLDGTSLPERSKIALHQYFQCGRPVKGSVTALPFFPEFDAKAQAHKIATSDRALVDNMYKYYFFARKEVEAAWQEKVVEKQIAPNCVPQQASYFYDTLQQACLDEKKRDSLMESREFKLFREIRDPICEQTILASWRANGQDASERGTLLHLQVQRFYENKLERGLESDDSVEFQQFANFHRNWVEARGLKIFRTELSMFDPYAQVCGTIDAVFVDKDADVNAYPLDVILVDWKRTKKNDSKSFYGDTFGSEPFEDWQACTQSKRYVQLMTYAKILQDNTGGRFRVTEMYNVLFHTHWDDYVVCPVPPFDAPRMEIAFEIARKHKLEQLRVQRSGIMEKMTHLTGSLVNEFDDSNEFDNSDEVLDTDMKCAEIAKDLQGYVIALNDIDTALAEMREYGEKTRAAKQAKRKRRKQ